MRKRSILVAGAGGLLLVAIAVGIGLGWWAWRHLSAELLLRNQQARVVVPNPMDVNIDILDNLDILLDTQLHTSVPIDQTLTLPIHDTLNVSVKFDHDVPIKMTVPIHDTIHLDQVVPVDGEVKARFLGVWISLPIKGKLPLKADIPVNLEVPVDQQVHLAFTAPAKVRLLQDLKVPLKTRITTTIPIHAALSVPVRSTLRARARILKPTSAMIASMNLKLPIDGIGLSLAHKQDEQDAATTSATKADTSDTPPSTPLSVKSVSVTTVDAQAPDGDKKAGGAHSVPVTTPGVAAGSTP